MAGFPVIPRRGIAPTWEPVPPPPSPVKTQMRAQRSGSHLKRKKERSEAQFSPPGGNGICAASPAAQRNTERKNEACAVSSNAAPLSAERGRRRSTSRKAAVRPSAMTGYVYETTDLSQSTSERPASITGLDTETTCKRIAKHRHAKRRKGFLRGGDWRCRAGASLRRSIAVAPLLKRVFGSFLPVQKGTAGPGARSPWGVGHINMTIWGLPQSGSTKNTPGTVVSASGVLF